MAILAAGCSTAPRAPDAAAPAARVPAGSPGAAIARTAAALVGAPYRWGGADPRGFDCSGLVHYAHERTGIAVPRTAAEQSRAAAPVRLGRLEPGDLLFFRVASRSVDHVGIYAGGGRFIHAPKSGRVVSFAYLEDPWYSRRLVGAGRFWSGGSAEALASSAP